MPAGDGSLAEILGVGLIFVLVAANGFFVAAEFSLVAVRRSRVAQLVGAGRAGARSLQRATDNLDSYLAATQLGITISSLALGWIGEPALVSLILPWLAGLGSLALAGAHALAVASCGRPSHQSVGQGGRLPQDNRGQGRGKPSGVTERRSRPFGSLGRWVVEPRESDSEQDC